MTSMSPFDAFTVKLPSKSVIVPLPVPFTRTLTPIIGSPDTASSLVPSNMHVRQVKDQY